jgi:hypothetical protein
MTLLDWTFCTRLLSFCRKAADLSSSILANGTFKVSNSDQQFRHGKAMIELETSTSSPSFRSSELSQPI